MTFFFNLPRRWGTLDTSSSSPIMTEIWQDSQDVTQWSYWPPKYPFEFSSNCDIVVRKFGSEETTFRWATAGDEMQRLFGPGSGASGNSGCGSSLGPDLSVGQVIRHQYQTQQYSGGLWSPSTGILNYSHLHVQSLSLTCAFILFQKWLLTWV